MFDSMLPLSYYRKIADLSAEHNVSVVQHIESHKICIRKIMQIYSLPVYEQLFYNPVKGLPRIYAIYEAPDHSSLTVIEEYISGDTLKEVLEICGVLSEQDVLTYLDQLCSILIQLQSFTPPIVHRDIKPSNIILTEDGRIVLIDLNAARLDDKKRSHASSPRADLYAAGILMRVLLTGTDANDAMLSHHLSRKIRAIIERCTQLDPRKRYPSAQALQRDIRKLMHK